MGRILLATLAISLMTSQARAVSTSSQSVSPVGPVVPATQGKTQPETIVDEPPFSPQSWSKGVHLLTGIGVNSSVFNTAQTYRDFGLGSNFKTDIGYYLNSHFAIELGSDVNLNWVDELLVWNTLFTIGVRLRFKSYLFNDEAGYIRAFVGSAPTVVFLNGTQPALQKVGASRIQFDGPVVGAGAGRFYKTAGGLIWFTEVAIAYQWLQTQQIVKDANDVPIVVSSASVTDNSKIFSAFFNIGLMIF